jgi:small nuclear ribonucleoprotein D2
MAPKKADKAKMAAADNRAGFGETDLPLGAVDTDKEAEFATGPLSVLRKAVETEAQVLIKLRNSRAVFARVKAFDRHWNMVLLEAREVWTEYPKGGKAAGRPIEKDRFISKLFLRGDSVVLVLLNPNK